MKSKKEKKESNDVIQITINKKKVLMCLGIIGAIALIVGLSFFASKNYKSDTVAFEFVDITIDEYLELMKSEEKKIIYIARPNCSYCQLENPIIRRLGSKYDLEIYYLDTSDFWDDELNDYNEDGYKLINSNQTYIDNEGFGTPNTVIVQNGSVVDAVYQYVEESELKELCESNGFINE